MDYTGEINAALLVTAEVRMEDKVFTVHRKPSLKISQLIEGCVYGVEYIHAQWRILR